MANQSERCHTTAEPSANWLYTPEFPDDWERTPLYSLAQWVNGLPFREIQSKATGKPVIKIAEIKDGITGQTKFTEQEFDDSVRVRSGDLLFSWSGQPETSIDAFWWRGPEGWLNQHVFRVTPKKQVDRTFFFYLLRYLKPNFVGIARNKQTTGLGHVTKRDLENVQVALPPPAEQRGIARILGTLDDKFELNRLMNETLEAVVSAIFRSWFVDFDPVRAKAEGRQPFGMDAEIVALFPDRLVDSELGEIPAGWEVTDVYRMSDVIYGAPFKSQMFNEVGQGLPLIRIRDLRTQNPTVFTTENHPKGYVVKPGDVVVGMDGEFRAYLWTGPEAWLNQRICCFKPHPGVSGAFVRYTIKEPLRVLEEAKTGTTVIHLGKSDIDAFRVVLPRPPILAAFGAIAERFEAKILSDATESRVLAAVRDALLPKLMSGEIRVTNVNHTAEH